jgi:hypothetical protein
MLISDEDMRALARAEGVREVALGDCVMGYDDTEPFVRYLRRVKPDKPHWYAVPAVDTPDEAALHSVDAQVRYVKAHSEAELISLLASNGLKPSQTKAPAKVDAEKIPGATNPYSDQWRGTEEQRNARITSLIKSGGTALAASLARSAGKTIMNQKLKA